MVQVTQVVACESLAQAGKARDQEDAQVATIPRRMTPTRPAVS